MKTPSNVWRVLLLSACLLCAARTPAVTFETVQSSYLGGGWFQYDVKVFYDPFFLQADLTQFSINITNGVDIEYGANPANWTNDTANAASWSYSGTSSPSRPYEQIFLMHSSATNYMLGTNAISVFSLVTSDIYPPGVVSGNFVGYINVPCLLPCPQAMADNSPTNHLETIVLIADPVIKKLFVGPTTYGLVFDWANDSTELLQASRDLNQWTNVTYLYGTNGETVWTTNQHLLDNGQYFRLLLAAGFQTTNVPPLVAARSVQTAPPIKNTSTTASTPRVVSCQPADDVVSVQLATSPGQTGRVRMLNARGAILQTQPFHATSNSVVVKFDARNVSGPMFFQAVTDKVNTGL